MSNLFLSTLTAFSTGLKAQMPNLFLSTLTALSVGSIRLKSKLNQSSDKKERKKRYSSNYAARCLALWGQWQDWLTWCPYTVTGWDSNFESHHLSQCGSKSNCLSRSVSLLHMRHTTPPSPLSSRPSLSVLHIRCALGFLVCFGEDLQILIQTLILVFTKTDLLGRHFKHWFWFS